MNAYKGKVRLVLQQIVKTEVAFAQQGDGNGKS